MTEVRIEASTFAAAARWVTALVSQLPASAWERPGLGDWDMRGLVGHTSRAILTVYKYRATVAGREDLESPAAYFERIAVTPGADPATILERGIDAGASLGEEPGAAFSALVEQTLANLETTQDALIACPAGGIRLSNYLPTRTFELVVHGLDIARAAGIPAEPPAEALHRAFEVVVDLAGRSGRGAEVILALTGRAALESGFSVLP